MDLSGAFYNLENNLYSYPYFFNSDKFVDANFNNELESVNFSGKIVDKIEKAVYTSSAVTTPFVNSVYTYSVSTNFTITDLSSIDLPTWLSIVYDSTTTSYKLTGTPTSTGLFNIELLASYNDFVSGQKFSINVDF